MFKREINYKILLFLLLISLNFDAVYNTCPTGDSNRILEGCYCKKG